MSYRETLRWRAFDTHGVITIPDADRLGVPSVELRKLAHRGALERLGHGVYRMTEIPPTPLSEYAEAVALAGTHAVIADDAVLALHDLALVNPRHITVATPDRIRATLPSTVHVIRRHLPAEDITDVDGVPTMTIPAAIRACRDHVMSDRLTHAVHDARERRLIDEATAQRLLVELSRGVSADFSVEMDPPTPHPARPSTSARPSRSTRPRLRSTTRTSTEVST